MDEYASTLRQAVDAALAGDLEALYVAQWMLSVLRNQNATPATGRWQTG